MNIEKIFISHVDNTQKHTKRKCTCLCIGINAIPGREIKFDIQKKEFGLWVLFQTRSEPSKYWTICFQFNINWGRYIEDVDFMTKKMRTINRVWSKWALDKEMKLFTDDEVNVQKGTIIIDSVDLHVS